MAYLAHIPMSFPGGASGKNLPANAGDVGLIPSLGPEDPWRRI